jgi:hypothetical protein
VFSFLWWLGWAYLAKKNAITATTPIAIAFRFYIGHRKNGLLSQLPIEVGPWCFFDTVFVLGVDVTTKATLDPAWALKTRF